MRSFASLLIYHTLKVYNLTINIRAMFVLIASYIMLKADDVYDVYMAYHSNSFKIKKIHCDFFKESSFLQVLFIILC